MQNYKIAVSKDGKKYSIIFKAESELAAKTRVHKEGYSILGIEKIEANSISGNIFIFQGYKGGELKYGKISGDDIFKTYIKLRKNLEYDVKSIYSEEEKDLSKEEKEKILKNLEEEYNIFYKGGKKEKIDELREKIKNDKDEDKKMKNFYQKKKLEETNKLIEFVLIKLEKVLARKSTEILDINNKEKLKIIYNSIIKIKKSSNIAKLREIGELALVKIGRIELEELEKNNTDDSKNLLKNTNKLLKQIGSKEQFIEKHKDVSYQVNKFFNKINEYFLELKTKKVKKEGVDKRSHSYMKNLLFLSKYRQRLKENTSYIIKNIFKIYFNTVLKEEIFLKRKVIKQNILILEAKEKGIGYSYTFIKKGFSQIITKILVFLNDLRLYIFSVIIVYVALFFIYLNVNYYLGIKDYNYDGIFYFIVLYFVYLILYFTRNLFLIILNFVILFFIIIFGVVNF